MTKLYIHPTSAHEQTRLHPIIARLHDVGYHPVIIGYGAYPIYVIAPRSQHETLKRHLRAIDPACRFAHFRPDIEGLNGICLTPDGDLAEIMTRFSIAVPGIVRSLAV